MKKPKKEPKSLEDLVVTACFRVKEVISESKEVRYTPQSEIRFGGSTPRYRMGYTSTLTLKVDQRNPRFTTNNAPVIKTLIFKGYSPVRAGDYIEAKIPRCDDEIKEIGSSKREYFDRPFKEQESAIEIAIFDSDYARFKLTRTDRAVDYVSAGK